MKKYAFILTAVVLSVALVVSVSPAQRRGGGGGGGGRGGGGGGARPSANRSPSMSRPAPKPSAPSRPSGGQKPSTRPSTPSKPSTGQKPSTRPSTPSKPSTGQKPSTRPEVGQKPSTRPGAGQKPSTPGAGQKPSTRPGGAVADRDKIQNNIKPGQQPSMPDWFKPGATPPTAGTLPAKPGTGDRPGKPGAGDRPEARPPVAGGDRPGTKPPGERPPGTRPPGGDRPPVAGRPPGYRPPASHPPYHPWYPDHPNYHDHHHWWQWATAAAVTGWVVNAWTNPIYYRYGRGGNVYYDNNVVYVNGEQYGSSEQYYNEASEIAASAPETTEQQTQEDNWLPLGVFALTKEGVNATNMYLQLALRKDGLIGGTFYNESTGVSHPVEGMVDEKTQRAVWKAADGTNENLIMETGIYNLSEDQAPVLVHFGPEETQEALLVRLEEEAEAPQPQEE